MALSSSQPPPTADELIFIDMGSQPDSADKSINRVVRSHVMRRYKRDRKRHQLQQRRQHHTQIEKRYQSVSSLSSGSGTQPVGQKMATFQNSLTPYNGNSESASPDVFAYCSKAYTTINLNMEQSPIMSFVPAVGLPVPADPRILMLLNHSRFKSSLYFQDILETIHHLRETSETTCHIMGIY